MSEATNTKLMDTEPGGENSQYESTATFTKPHSKSEGQFGDSTPTEASQVSQKEKAERGEKTAENVRYGEAISEHGFGGETVGNEGGVGVGEGKTTGQVRRAQGYGGGSGVGG